MKNFQQLVGSGSPILFDGSTATLLFDRGIFINRSFDEVNVSQPELISSIHHEYANAGANVITTNTWSANRIKLSHYGFSHMVKDINLAGAKLAVKVASEHQCFVAGSMGPLGLRIEPWGPTSFAEAEEIFLQQAEGLAAGGIDLFTLESFDDLNELQQAISAIRKCSQLPIVAQMSVNDDGESVYGAKPEWFTEKLKDWGACLVGINGGNGPASLLEVARKLRQKNIGGLIMRPSAGLPREVNGRMIYMASAEYMSEFARQALLAGVQAIGGCSGTTPQHVKAMASALRQHSAFRFGETAKIVVGNENSENISLTANIPLAPATNWSQKIAKGERVVSVELLPPKGMDVSVIQARSLQCFQKGIDAINIPDGPRASARMSALATALSIQQNVGIETVLHYVCRDRNLLGMQSDLIGAASLGLKNVLCVTGDPPKLGPYPHSTAVFDVDAIGLVNMVSQLNKGLDLAGSSIGAPCQFSIGVGANPVAPDVEKELNRFRYKIEAGAQWCITQPVFEMNSFQKFLDFAGKFNVPVIAGIWPFASLRNAEFMANEVPGVFVPKLLIQRMQRFEKDADQAKEGIQIVLELMEQMKTLVQGFQISAPLGKSEIAISVCEQAGLTL